MVLCDWIEVDIDGGINSEVLLTTALLVLHSSSSLKVLQLNIFLKVQVQPQYW